jgi:phasin
MTNKPYEIPAEMRDFAEKSVEQARKAFTGFLDAAQKATSSVESSIPQNKVMELGTQAAQFTEKSINAAFDHAQKLVRAKDLQEVFALQTEYLQTQAKELGAIMQNATKK